MMHKLVNSAKVLFNSQECRCKIVTYKQFFQTTSHLYCSQSYSHKNVILSEDKKDDENNQHNLPPDLFRKHKVFRDEDAAIIFDVNEEKKRIDLGQLHIEEEQSDPYAGINLNHGVNGVFNIEDLIAVLQKDNARQIFVATVPAELTYVDYIVIVSGKSPRHIHALATFVRKLYKLKKNHNETVPRIEGENSKDWLALDLGNIALHIFSRETRKKYDLETLWTVGSKFDDLSNQKENEIDIMSKYNEFLKDLHPAE